MSEGKDAPTVNPGILIVPEVSEVICINVTIIDHNLHLSPKVTITIKSQIPKGVLGYYFRSYRVPLLPSGSTLL